MVDSDWAESMGYLGRERGRDTLGRRTSRRLSYSHRANLIYCSANERDREQRAGGQSKLISLGLVSVQLHQLQGGCRQPEVLTVFWNPGLHLDPKS